MGRKPSVRGAIIAVVTTVLVILYPIAVYFGLTRFSTRVVGLILLALVIPGLILRLARHRGVPRERLWAVIRVPLSVVVIVGLGTAFDQPVTLLILPVVINVVLLVQFAATLRQPVSMVEQFARIREPELPPGGPAYCRRVTQVWCAFFVLNGGVAGALAGWGPISWWAAYTGLVSYVLMGMLFTGEYIVRKAIFRRFDDTLPDRLLAKLLPSGADRGADPGTES